MKLVKLFAFLFFLLPSLVLNASEVQIVSAEAECTAGNHCIFRATLKHDDSGWDHYANGWQVMDEKGRLLVRRTLYHPHVKEQPFTRSSERVFVPLSTTKVWIRAGDNKSGLNSRPYILKLR